LLRSGRAAKDGVFLGRTQLLPRFRRPESRRLDLDPRSLLLFGLGARARTNAAKRGMHGNNEAKTREQQMPRTQHYEQASQTPDIPSPRRPGLTAQKCAS